MIIANCKIDIIMKLIKISFIINAIIIKFRQSSFSIHGELRVPQKNLVPY